MFAKMVFSVLVFVWPLTALGQQSSVSVWHTANAGILIEAGGTRILVDGLFRHHTEWEGFTYTHLDSAQTSEARATDGLLADIDLLLATHVHRDHFHPAEVAGYLRENEKTVFVANAQLVESVLEDDVNSPQLSDRLIQVDATPAAVANYEVDGIGLTLAAIPHAGAPYGWIDNNAILIEVGGQRILHVGDAVPDPDLFAGIASYAAGVDLVIAPFWFLLQAPSQEQTGHRIVTEILAAKQVVAVHLPPEPTRVERYTKMLRDAYPEITVATGVLQKIR